MKVSTILATNGNNLVIIAPERPIQEAVALAVFGICRFWKRVRCWGKFLLEMC